MAANGGIPDLGKLKPVPPELAAEARGAAELEMGMRCQHCAQRVGTGAQFYLLAPEHSDTGVTVLRIRVTVCSRESCREFYGQVASEATLMVPVEFRWLDSEGVDDAAYDEIPAPDGARSD